MSIFRVFMRNITVLSGFDIHPNMKYDSNNLPEQHARMCFQHPSADLSCWNRAFSCSWWWIETKCRTIRDNTNWTRLLRRTFDVELCPNYADDEWKCAFYAKIDTLNECFDMKCSKVSIFRIFVASFDSASKFVVFDGSEEWEWHFCLSLLAELSTGFAK